MDRSEETSAQLLKEIGDDLSNSSLWLTFQSNLERRYRAFTDETRNIHYRHVSAFGLIVYNLFLVTDWQIMPDIFWLAAILHLSILTPLCIAAKIIMHRHPRQSQPMLFATLTLMVAFSALIYSQSKTAGALVLPFAFPTILITGNLLLPLRFNLALPFSVLSGLIIVPAIMLHPGYANGLQLFTLLTVLSACGLTVYAAYQMESVDRRAFLLSLRENLRAEILAHDNSHLRALAGTDGLTGIGNRRLFDVMLERLWHEAEAAGEPLGLLLLDADHFKALNDIYGHQAGDRCLVLIGAILREHTREHRDYAARYGGEEFALLIPKAALDRAQDVAERLRVAVETAPVVLDGPACAGALHVSVGCASCIPHHGIVSSALVEAADAALYHAKRAGRNRIHPPRDEIVNILYPISEKTRTAFGLQQVEQ